MLREFADSQDSSNINVIVITENNPKDAEHLYPAARKIKEECLKRDMPFFPVLVPGSNYISDFDKGNPNIVIRNVKEPEKNIELDPENTVVLIRGSCIHDPVALALLTYFEAKGAFIVTSKEVIELCADKYNTTVKLQSSGIPVPRTALIPNAKAIPAALKSIGGKFPIVLKTMRGSHGIGVSRIDSIESLAGVLQTLWKYKAKLLIQEYLDSDYDVRTFIVKGKIIASMRRNRIDGDFRSNFSLGGEVEPYKLSELEKKVALDAAKIVGSYYCGVDHMVVDDLPYVIEVNALPGFLGMLKATGVNAMQYLFDSICDKSNWPAKSNEIGFMEKMTFPEIHGMKLDAKADTGNGLYNVLHADNIKIIDDVVSFEVFGNKVVKKIKDILEIKKGGLQDYTEDRVLVDFDVEFDGKTFSNVPFTLDNRSDRSPVLLCRNFLCELGVNINPKLKFSLGENVDFKQFRKMFL